MRFTVLSSFFPSHAHGIVVERAHDVEVEVDPLEDVADMDEQARRKMFGK